MRVKRSRQHDIIKKKNNYDCLPMKSSTSLYWDPSNIVLLFCHWCCRFQDDLQLETVR